MEGVKGGMVIREWGAGLVLMRDSTLVNPTSAAAP